MEKLNSKTCEACRVDAPHVTQEEMDEWLPQIPDWGMKEINGILRLIRKYTFSDFAHALDFTNKVGEISESEGHHPALLTEWGSVEVSWWSHKMKGLHVNDFIMAAKTDEIFEKFR